MIVTILFSLLFACFFRMYGVVSASTRSHNLSYFLFSLFLVIGDSFKKYGSFWGVWGNPFVDSDLAVLLFEDMASFFGFLNGFAGNLLMILSSICKGIGYFFILQYTLESAKYFCKKHILFSASPLCAFADRFWKKDAFLRVFLFLFLAWIPYLLIKFPGTVCNDAQDQVEEFLLGILSARHPVFLTLIYGSFARLGEVLGNLDIGLFLFLLLQCALMASIFAYGIVSVHKFAQNNTVSTLLIFLFAFSPAFPSFATTMLNDSLYCTFFVLFVIELLFIIHELENHILSNKHVMRIAVASLLMCLTRNNGILIVLPVIVSLIVIFYFRMRKSVTKFCTVSALLLLPLILYAGVISFQGNMSGSHDDNVGDLLSQPFQQTARYVKTHPEDVTAEQAQIINRVLDYEHLGELYNPIVSDPVKATYKKDPTALSDYFHVWAEQGRKHPLTYAEATTESNYFLFYPDEPNIRAYYVMDDSLSGFSNSVLKAARTLLLAFVMGLSLIPIVSCLINPVFYVWGFLYIFIDSAAKKHSRYAFLVLLPLLIQIINVILGPAVFNHPRYFYPIYWSIPFFAVFLYRTQLSANISSVSSSQENISTSAAADS